MSSNTPLVSVVIPAYNRGSLIRKTIESVINQSYANLEILVVDDSSVDNTADVVAAMDDSRIRYFRHDINKGAPAARNTGILHSRGEFIAFLDSDDTWDREKIREQLDVMISAGPDVALVYAGIRKVNPDGECVGIKKPVYRGRIFSRLLRDNVIGSTSAPLIRVQVLKEDVGGFDESLPSRQDYDLWLRISRKYAVEYVSRPLVDYLVHDDRISANSEWRIRGSKLILEKYWNEIKAHPAILAEHYYRLGRQYINMGNKVQARGYLFKPLTLLFKPKGVLIYLLKNLQSP
jgi:glycosyltransferase involved in cell wall biosynthesis